jgi:hypothetical protein
MRFRINWGLPAYIFSFFILGLNLLFFYNLFSYFHPIILLFFIPSLALDVVFYPVFNSLLNKILKKEYYPLIISPKGIELNNRLHLWESIKSISFQTGRLIHDYRAFQGFKLPALQMIYVLDKEGKEYSSVLDIDYFLKGQREKNNLIEARKEIFDFGRMNLISDWAEKR